MLYLSGKRFIHMLIHLIHSFIHTCMHTCIHTYMHAYIHTYVHTYIHTHTHIYIYRERECLCGGLRKIMSTRRRYACVCKQYTVWKRMPIVICISSHSYTFKAMLLYTCALRIRRCTCCMHVGCVCVSPRKFQGHLGGNSSKAEARGTHTDSSANKAGL